MKQHRDVQGILLDFDGTLVDSEPLYYQANREAFRLYGHDILEEEYYYHWSLLGESAQGEVHRYQLTGVDLNRVKKVANDNFRQLIDEHPIPLLPGARSILIELPKRGYPTVIASNTPADHIQRILSRVGLTDIPVPIIGTEPGLRPKPFPDIFLKAVNWLGVKPAECLVIEDTVKGLRAAKSAGIPCIIVRYSRYPEISWEGAEAVISNLNELLTLLPDRNPL